ncbi:MAG: hypothetical protein MK135_11505, partial [Polyangiaceae bacterium]|nr:hypothetical protein [Polyangiaceae bacterium]
MVKASGEGREFHLYLAPECQNDRFCTVELPQIEWKQLGREFAGKEVQFELIASDGTEFTASEPLSIQFSPEPVFGALYYWASISEVIKRASFGSERAVDFIVPGKNVDYECVACHSVSRDGSTIAFAVGPHEGENVTGIQTTSTLDPELAAIQPTKGTSPYAAKHVHDSAWDGQGPIDNLGNNVALSPDGSLMAVNGTRIDENDNLWPIFLEIRDAQSNDTVISKIETTDANNPFGTEGMGIHPEFSPDGQQLAVTHAQNAEGGIGLSAWRANQ